MAKNREVVIEQKQEQTSVFDKGMRSLKDLLASASIRRTSPDELKVEDKYVRTFVINGYPSSTHIGFLRSLYDYEYDLDVAVYIEPADERNSLMELTKEITVAEAQLATEREAGKRIRKAVCPHPGLAFLFPPVLAERRENAVVEPPTAMGIKHASTVPVGLPV